MNLQKHTYCATASGNKLVADHLKRITDKFLFHGIQPIALILQGSFGRGEGSVGLDANGNLTPLNDYDIAIVVESSLSLQKRRVLKKLKLSLIAELGIWHLDFNVFKLSELREETVKMMLFDMKFGSAVFYGDSSVLNQIPYSPSSQIPVAEILNLLVNRLVTLLEGHPLTASHLTNAHKARQIAKVYYAVIDALLISRHSYRTHYREKVRALAALEEFLEPNQSSLLSTLISRIDWVELAWSNALETDQTTEECLLESWEVASYLLIDQIYSLTLAGKALGEVSISQSDRRCKDIFLNWRLGIVEPQSLTHFILQILYQTIGRRHHRREVEKKLYTFISSYPEGAYCEAINYSVPVFPRFNNESSPRGLDEWQQIANRLIGEWYSSIQ